MQGLEPYNQEAEEALVGAFFLEENLLKECAIRPEQLHSRKLRQIYSQKRKAIQIAEKIMQQAKTFDISQTLSEGISELMAVEEEQYVVLHPH